ncbi:MAG TPA: insulinase family protein [Pyrinomonadaceae bacterium]|nr:insulinase family protein [Pyrinomonadaceae bacterium]
MKLIALKSLLIKGVLAAAVLVLFQSSVPAQVPMEPERARLLNGLRVLIWSRPGDQEVLIKLRVHSGAAFDLAGKAGTMALLGDILFPDPTTREYFTEEMQGRLNVTTNYDSLTITMQGRAREFERMVEILRTALVTPQLTPENVAKVREGRIKVLKETAISPAMLADRAIAARLFGDFPYGRPYGGSVESLERVQRADLMLARERFLSANTSTLTIIGGVQSNRVMRALRQLLGIWRKSEKVVPATFRQPQAPDARTLIINSPADQSVEVRLGLRGFSRQDADTPATELLAVLARQRWIKQVPELAQRPVFVRHEAFVLPGMFVMGVGVDNLLAGKALASAREVIQSLANSPVSAAEVDQARNEVLALANKELANADGIAGAWLDSDTYGLPSIAEQLRTLSAITSADIQRAASRLVRDSAFASVVVGNAEVLKAQIERYGKVESMGEIAPKIDPPVESRSDLKTNNNVKPQIKTPQKPE